jgi:2,4-dienoyl-CoA reductase-like NADH-dependent reductase (Old Yellow Enzyme family)
MYRPTLATRPPSSGDYPGEATLRWPSNLPYGEHFCYPAHALSRDDIHFPYREYARAAERALEAGFEWLELHYAHGYLGASFFSPLANQRTDEYGGSDENRARFLVEPLTSAREVWPERLPLKMRPGCEDLHREGVQLEDSLVAIDMMKERGLDLADLSLGFNTNYMTAPPFSDIGFMVELGARVRSDVGIPVAVSWNLESRQTQISRSVTRRSISSCLVDPLWPTRTGPSGPHGSSAEPTRSP